jgi:hypothetical protein
MSTYAVVHPPFQEIWVYVLWPSMLLQFFSLVGMWRACLITPSTPFVCSPQKLPVLLAPLKRSGPMTLRTDLLDEHVYIFSRQEVLTLLADKPELSSLTV